MCFKTVESFHESILSRIEVNKAKRSRQRRILKLDIHYSSGERVVAKTEQKSLAVGAYCPVLGFNISLISEGIANVNNCVLPIGKEYPFDGFLLLEFISTIMDV